MADFNTAFRELQAALVDLDGDGVPDPMPPNAMAGMRDAGGFPQMVANNPRGWGNAPPGNVWQRDPGMISGELRNTERPREYTAPIAEMTPPVIPGMGTVLQAAPRVAGLVAGGMGLSAMMSGEGEGTEGPAQNLYKQQAALAQRLEAVRAKADAEEANGGRGPNWNKLNAEVQSLSNELAGVNAMLKEETTRNSPERQQDIAKRAADLAAEEQKRLASTPFRERYPNAAGALPMAGLAIAGAIPGAIGAKKAVGSFFPGSYAGRMRAGISEAEGAIASGNQNHMDISRRYLENLVADQPTRSGNAMAAASAGAAGGGLAAEANMFPDQYDAYNLPPGPEQQAAHDRALDPRNYIERGAIGTLTGLSGYKIGSKFPERKPDIPRANAMADFMRSNPTSTPQAPRVLTKDANGRLHDERGWYTSAPNAKK
jgi:hypothetical protein